MPRVRRESTPPQATRISYRDDDDNLHQDYLNLPPPFLLLLFLLSNLHRRQEKVLRSCPFFFFSFFSSFSSFSLPYSSPSSNQLQPAEGLKHAGAADPLEYSCVLYQQSCFDISMQWPNPSLSRSSPPTASNCPDCDMMREQGKNIPLLAAASSPHSARLSSKTPFFFPSFSGDAGKP